MKFSNFFHNSFLFVLPLALVLQTGCALNNARIEALERENAEQRQRIWKSNVKMDDFRRENEALRNQIAQLESNSSRGSSRQHSVLGGSATSGATSGSAGSPLLSPLPERSGSSPLSPTPHTSSGGTLPLSTTPPPSSLGTPTTEGVPDWLEPEAKALNPPSGSLVTPEGAARQVRVRKTDSREVYSVELLPEKAYAIHYQGVHAEFRLKDAAGNIVLAPGNIVVKITDPKKPPKSALVSKWVYTPQKIAEIINSGNAGLSIPLDMEWVKDCPENLNLEIHILYQTSDKRLLIDRKPIDLARGSYEDASGLASNAASGLQAAPVAPPVGSAAGAQDPFLERPQWSPNPL
ncbi:MAG: hypothetical protein Q4D38_04915 [Planctomycetia bacterium]|nr:hypothetical protein [Planctomycetia bacterium]